MNTTLRFHFTLVRTAIVKKKTSVGEGGREEVHALTLGGSINWWGHGGCHVSVEASQKAKYRTSL